MIADLLKDANTRRACSLSQLPNDLKRMLRIQFKEFINCIEETEKLQNEKTDSLLLSIGAVVVSIAGRKVILD